MKKAGTGQKRNRSIFRFSTLAFAIHAVSMGGLVVIPMQQAYAETARVKSYNIPAGRLANVLNQFAEQSGTSIAMDTAYAYLSAATDFEVSQVVDKTKGIHAKIRKADFKEFESK
nr:hypothetical protein [Acinetobacter baumannii]